MTTVPCRPLSTLPPLVINYELPTESASGRPSRFSGLGLSPMPVGDFGPMPFHLDPRNGVLTLSDARPLLEQ